MASDDDSSFRVYPAVICLWHLSDRYINQLSARQRRGQLSIAHNPQEVSPLEESREVKDKAWHSCVLNWSRSTDDGLWRAETHEPSCLKLLLILYSREGLIWSLCFHAVMFACSLESFWFKSNAIVPMKVDWLLVFYLMAFVYRTNLCCDVAEHCVFSPFAVSPAQVWGRMR